MTVLAADVPKKSCWDYFTWVPVLNPAVKENSYAIDRDLLASRVTAIAKVAFIMLVAALPMYFICPLGSLVLVSLATCSLALPQLDSWAAERAANVKAVNDFLKENGDSAQSHILHNVNAARLFVQKKGDVNQLDIAVLCRNGALDFEVFKCLVDNGVNLHSVFKSWPLFLWIAESKNPMYLQYVLKQKKVKVGDFSSHQQYFMWRDLQNQQVATLLAQYGFDVNARSDKGYTPLHTIACRSDVVEHCCLDPFVHVKALLQCGADKSLTVGVKELSAADPNRMVQKTALQLTQNPEIQKLLA